jgi:hypothetical protein
VPNKNFAVTKDSLIANSGSSNLGAGAGGHLPVGYYSGYVFRALMQFALDFSDVSQITSAILWVRTSSQTHLAFGSAPRVIVSRAYTSWSEGSQSCESGYSASNSVVYPGPSIRTTDQCTSSTFSGAENTWTGIDITPIIESWAPAATLKRDGSPGDAQANMGVRVQSFNEGSGTYTTEFLSRSSSSDPYIALAYVSNRPPTAPTLSAPNGQLLSTQTTPTFSFSASDPDVGDTLAAYDIQVSTDPTFATVTHWNLVGATGSITGWSVARAYTGSALSGAVAAYYWRARAKDNNGAYGPWSANKTFSLNQVPTITTLPYAGANHVAPIWNLADLVTVLTPKPQFTIAVTDPDGDGIIAYDVQISGQAVETVAGNWASGATIIHKSARTLVNGTAYTVQFRCKDSTGEYGPWSALVNFKVWYSQAIYDWNAAGSSQWTVTTTGAVGTTQLLYRSATGAAGAGASSWKTSLPISGAYLNIMLRTASSGSGTPTRPGVSTIKITYQTTATLPYNWTFTGLGDPGAAGADDNTHRYGTSSILMNADNILGGTNVYAWQDVPIDPTQTYAFGVWVRGTGFPNPGPTASMYLFPGGSSSGALKRSSLLQLGQATGDWLRLVGVATPDDLQGNNAVRVMLHIQRSAGIGGQVWWDAAMLAEGNVLPVWTPALVGAPVVLDANGAIIDGTAGAIFRLLGSGGGARDIVELGVSGLVFGGDTELSSPAQNVMQWGGRQRALFVIGPWVAPVGFLTASQVAKQVPFAGREAIPTSTYDGRPNFPFNSGRIIGIATRSAATPTAAGLSVSASRAGANVGTPIVYASGGLVYQAVYFAPVAMSLNQSVGVNFDTTAGFADGATQAFSAWLICEADYPSGVS